MRLHDFLFFFHILKNEIKNDFLTIRCFVCLFKNLLRVLDVATKYFYRFSRPITFAI